MVKFFVVVLIFLAVVVFAGNSDIDTDDEDPNYFNGFVEDPLSINIQGNIYDIYYKELLPYSGSEKSWLGKPIDLVEYEIKDFENKETPFFVYMNKRTRRYRFFCHPLQ